MRSWISALALGVALPVGAQVEMSSRRCVAQYQYLYGGGPDTYSGGANNERTSSVTSDSVSAQLDESGSGNYLQWTWSAAVQANIQSNFTIEGAWTEATGIAGSSSTVAGGAGGGDIGLAQLFTNSPGNLQEFLFLVSIPQDYSLFGFVSHDVPTGGNPAAVSIEFWNGFAWSTVYSSANVNGQQGLFGNSGTMGPGLYRLSSYLICGATVGPPGTLAFSYTMNSNFQFDVAPVGRAIEGVVQLQQWLAPTGGEVVQYVLEPVATGPSESGSVVLDSVGRFRIAVRPSMKPGTYTLWMKGRKWQGRVTTLHVPASGVGQAGALLLRAGDSDNNNVVDSDDYDILIQSFGEAPGNPGYDERADLDGVNGVDTDDFDILVQHFGEQGDEY